MRKKRKTVTLPSMHTVKQKEFKNASLKLKEKGGPEEFLEIDGGKWELSFICFI